jgi:type I restriction enzyme M protein
VDAHLVDAHLVDAHLVDAHLVDALSAPGDHKGRPYADIPGFCKSATLDEIRGHGHVLTPGRYVGAEAVEDDGEPFEEKMARLASVLLEQTHRANQLDEAIRSSLESLGYGT